MMSREMEDKKSQIQQVIQMASTVTSQMSREKGSPDGKLSSSQSLVLNVLSWLKPLTSTSSGMPNLV